MSLRGGNYLCEPRTEVRNMASPFLTEPETQYRAQARFHLSSHALADFRACPLLYRQKQLGLIPDADHAAFLVGRAIHVMTLEGREAYTRGFAIGGPINEKTAKPYGRETKAFADWAQSCGKPVLSHDQADLVEQLAGAVHRHPVAATLLAAGQAEAVLRLPYAGISCQGRLDWVVGAGQALCDLKTCDDLTWFEADARRFGYAHQVAFYRALVREATGQVPEVSLIAVEKRAPYRCGVWRMTGQVLDQAERENLAAMRRLEQSQRTDTWPTGYEDIRPFDYIA
jgi:hypothetical protein